MQSAGRGDDWRSFSLPAPRRGALDEAGAQPIVAAADSGKGTKSIASMRPGTRRLITTALGRGLRKRCPHCGEGKLFSGWSHLARCSTCALVFERNPGDPWAFTIIGDRLPVAAIIALIYFGVVRSCLLMRLTILDVFVVLLVCPYTIRLRYGSTY